MNLAGQHTVVVGLARSGLAAARFLVSRGARVTISDQNAAANLGAMLEQARSLGVRLELGGHLAATFDSADLIVVSPGVPLTIKPLARARQKGIEIIGEMELAARHISSPILAVSGTNGKTTTTELLGRMLADSGRKVYVGGNIGEPLIDIAGRDAGLDAVVAEISSFQLDSAPTFRPHVAVLLNITPDHLDRYDGLQSYAASKGRLFKHQTHRDYAVCHGTDPLVQQLASSARSRVLNFYPAGLDRGLSADGAVIRPSHIDCTVAGIGQGRLDLSRTRLKGSHNVENIAAAALAALCGGAVWDGIQRALDDYQPAAHRLEWVRSVHEVDFYNDSKATNVDAVRRALESFNRPVILIMGGRNKGYDFSSLFAEVQRCVKQLIVIGEAAAEIMATLRQAPRQGARQADDMADAVKQAWSAAEAGDVILLSPACASFDMFANYLQRGDEFRRLSKELA